MSEDRIKVAVVEDDGSCLRALERLLRAAGFECRGYPAEAFLQESPHPLVDKLS